ncbi:hypothetical protein [Diaphorobacter sp.]|uniref:hypothetical protein n=1 Tax=Diaphorobacter sp. TaxID=1934310 RepID=UPI00258A18F2|nr:hypothetical protein [Diaphorobacter sp.]
MQYALIKAGRVTNVIVSSPEFAAQIAPQWERVEPLETEQNQGVGIGWMWNGARFLAPAHAHVAAPRMVSVLGFRRRFTPAEKAAIEWAAVDRADQPDAQRKQAAELRAMLADQAAATFIDLDDAATTGGVRKLEAMGLIGAGRAAQILGAPVQLEERP